MAILKNTVQVNSGNTGWTRSNVLDALEETIADLGWNSGSQVNGVVTSLAHPENSESVWGGDDFRTGLSTNWNHCGGPGITIRASKYYRYAVDVDAGAYVFRQWYLPTYYTYATVDIGVNNFSVGDPLVWRPSSSNTTALGSALPGDTVYIAQYSTENIQTGLVKFAPTEADAIAGTNILVHNSSAVNSTWRFYNPAHTDNTQLIDGIQQNDQILFYNNDNYLDARKQTSNFKFTTNSGDGSDYNISGTDRSTTHTSASDPGITVYEGDAITFDNSALSGSHPMYIRVSDGGASVTSPAATGEGTDTVSWIPTTAGTYYYQCSVAGHEGMLGTITVTANPSTAVALTSAHPLWFQDTAGAYDADRVINTVNYVDINSTYKFFPGPDSVYNPETGTGYIGGTDANWLIRMWKQGTYYIVCENHPSMTVSFTVNPGPGRVYMWDNRVEYPYYDYTVPQDGSRSALNLRIYREDDAVPSKIAGIRVMDLNSTGWSESDTFTIPGTAVGGTSPENDILVGASTDETSDGASDGTASLHVCNFGAGVNAVFKNPSTNRLMIRLENDAIKTYGTTHYLMELTDDHTIEFRSGISPKFLGFDPNNSITDRMGRWGGKDGFDYFSNHWSFEINGQGGVNSFDFATSSTPTAYPLKIVSYKAQSPQDADFSIIQFIQTINGNDNPYATWFFHKGNNYGTDIWDMDHVWQGGLTRIYTQSDANYSIGFTTSGCNGQRQQEFSDDNNSTARMMREALYGYFRNPTTSNSYSYCQQVFSPNMAVDNYLGQSGYVVKTNVPYFRHNEYDDLERPITWDPTGFSKVPFDVYAGNKNDYTEEFQSMPTEANYYRPMKTLPIATELSPCPYYLPDDFVMIQFDISPGLASVRPGDTVTISASEVYEVVRASYENNDETYDGITDNRTRGIIFAARTT